MQASEAQVHAVRRTTVQDYWVRSDIGNGGSEDLGSHSDDALCTFLGSEMEFTGPSHSCHVRVHPCPCFICSVSLQLVCIVHGIGTRLCHHLGSHSVLPQESCAQKFQASQVARVLFCLYGSFFSSGTSIYLASYHIVHTYIINVYFRVLRCTIFATFPS